ncbi:MAG: ParB/Srx family N-terminal domain-containing protein [Magnetococcales bacterium]|nr:ParB/Srx family N-terminal domain-containing protein [Magnetococcales bacterium]
MKNCKHTLEKGDIFCMPVASGRPTQFAVGMVSVDCKRKTLEALHLKGTLEDELCEEGNLVPVVIGPGKVFYLADHHHLCTALYRSEVIPEESKYVFAYVVDDWSVLEPDQFWQSMIEGHLCWLWDEKGNGPLNPGLLPHHVNGLLNDPYRTMARWVRDLGCYTKDVLKTRHRPMCQEEKYLPEKQAKAFFIEFRWANFLRQNVHLKLHRPDFSLTCRSMPYSGLYLKREGEELIKAFDIVVDLIGCHQLQEVTYDREGCLEKS